MTVIQDPIHSSAFLESMYNLPTKCVLHTVGPIMDHGL